MHIAIIGTRGIPNYHGGFEQFAEYLSQGLVDRGHQVTVYNSDKHPHKEGEWKGVRIIHCVDYEHHIGTAGQFFFDFNCIMDTRRKNYDVILQLGYTSSSIWGWLLPRKKSIVTTNMDGLEWKRTKYSKPVQQFLKFAERLGTIYSDYLIADSLGIQSHLKGYYNKDSIYIPYGANLFMDPIQSKLNQFKLTPYSYNMLIARLEPENSVEIILDGHALSTTKMPFLVVGKYQTSYGEYLKKKYANNMQIRFLGGIYDIEILNNLRHFSNLYFHGHTVGGTNPSLLEAMASQSLICAHNNIFNKTILGEDAFYFNNEMDVATLMDTKNKQMSLKLIKENNNKIKFIYTWPIVIEQYLDHFEAILEKKKSKSFIS